MIPTSERWEHGSEFHWLDYEPLAEPTIHPWSDVPSVFFGSGRDALRALLAHGAKELGWKQIWIPSYFCQEFAVAMDGADLGLDVYLDIPGEQPVWPLTTDRTDVVLVVNTFGVRKEIDLSPLRIRGVSVIEDQYKLAVPRLVKIALFER